MRFRRNPAFEKELRATPEFQASMAKAAIELAGYIKIAAEPSRHTGYYIRRIVPVGDRVQVRDWGWHFSEYGSIHNPPYAPVRRGALMAGLRFEDSRVDLA